MSTSDTTTVLPEDYTVGAEGGPKWDVETITGKTRRVQERNRSTTQPWFEWNIAYSVKDAESAKTLRRIRDAHQGGLYPLLFKWQDDFEAEEELFASDVGTEFQLVVNRDVNDHQLDIEIYRPVEGTVTIQQGPALDDTNTVTLTEGVDYDIDYSTGVVTLTSTLPTGDSLWWSGEFRFAVHFVGDPPIRFDSENLRAFEDIILESIE